MQKFNIDVICIIAAVCVAGAGCYFSNREDKKPGGGTGSCTETAGSLNNELGREQSDTVGRIAGSIGRLEAIRGITEKTNSDLESLRGLDRRSSGIYEEIRAECEILENYFRGVSGIIGGLDNSAGGGQVESGGGR